MPLMLDGDDDDDFDSLTPRSIRLRNPTPPPKRPVPISASQQQRQRPRQQQQQSQQKKARTEPASTPPRSYTHQTHNPASSQSSGLVVPLISKPRNGFPLSLKKPTSKSNSNDQINSQSTTFLSTATSNSQYLPNASRSLNARKEDVMIVLNSGSEGDSDVELTQNTASLSTPTLKIRPTQIGGVQSSNSFSRNSTFQDKAPALRTDIYNTQETVASSQGSVEYNQDSNRPDDYEAAPSSPVPVDLDIKIDHTVNRETQWSLSPEIENPHLSDLVATVTKNDIAIDSLAAATSPSPPMSSFIDRLNDTCTYSTYSIDTNSMSTLHSEDSLPSIFERDDMECVICGKSLAHLDPARADYHVNNCIDEQQLHSNVEQSLDLKTKLPQTSAKHDEFAGAQVDYLVRVTKCPICKLDWPLRAKVKSGTVTPSRRKVEHMKRCAKANKRSIQSLLYQVRLLKEQYERSLVLGTSAETDYITESQDVDVESRVEDSNSSDESTPKKSPLETHQKPKSRNTVKTQVVSIADNADGEFISDAIITTVHAPPSARSKMTKLQRMHHDQQDDSLQLALAISMSMHDRDSPETHAGLNIGSSSGSSDPSSTWLMTPAVSGKGSKKRKPANQERNTTTVLPFAEVQHLIQSNVQALLFPDIDNPNAPSIHGNDGDGGSVLLKTPPLGPSRFSESIEDADIEANLSQISESSKKSPTKSLWNLSHLKDTFNVSSEENVISLDKNEIGTALVHSPTRRVFDSEKYVSRFMKRYIQQDQIINKTSKSPDPTESQQGGNKYESPLWSVSRSRRISLREQRKKKEEDSVSALKIEIIEHLDEMQRSIQQAKRVAYTKILDSIERHPVAAAQLTPPSASPAFVKELQKDNIAEIDTDILSQDIYNPPSSPLLRYSKASGTENALSPQLPSTFPRTSPSPSTSDKNPLDDRRESPLREALSQDLNRSCTMDDYEPNQEDNQIYGSGILVYSPSQLSPQQLSPQQLSPQPQLPLLQQELPLSRSQSPQRIAISPPRALSPYEFQELSPPPVFAPLKRPVKSSRRKKATRESSPPSPSFVIEELPPRLDFAGLGYHKAEELADIGSSDSDVDQNSRSKGIGTPKKSRQSDKKANRTVSRRVPRRTYSTYKTEMSHLEQLQPKQPLTSKQRAHSTSIELEPLPSTSAIGGEGGLEEINNWPTVSQLLAARRAAAMRPEEQEQEQEQTYLSQPETSSPHLPPIESSYRPSSSHSNVPTRPGMNDLMESYRKAAARARNVGLAPSQAGSISQPQPTSRPQSQNLTQPLTQPSSQAGTKTPSKRKSRLRAEEFAAEAARAVETMKAHETMPKYHLMSVSTLRMLAMSFGLKATTKVLLAEQLSAIWERVHSELPAPSQQGLGESDIHQQDDNLINGEPSNRGGKTQVERERVKDQDDLDEQTDLIDQENVVSSSPRPFQSIDDSAPGYMSPILSDNDHTYDYMFDDSYGDKRDINFNMDYDNEYRNADNDFDSRSHEVIFSLDSNFGNDRGTTFDNIERTEEKSSALMGRGEQRMNIHIKDNTTIHGEDADQEPERSDDSSFDEDFSQSSQNDSENDNNMEDHDQAGDEPIDTTPMLERQLFDLLRKTPYLWKQYLIYKPLNIEQVWEACDAAQIQCTRQQVRQFLDKHSIICFIPANSTLQSWRKTRAKKQKRTHA
ncbi:hypothetical protein FBU30_010064 [Linnemannia zychae]|nr:hypothetical protein FBU30_010064 [Linnemannia zychae]